MSKQFAPLTNDEAKAQEYFKARARTHDAMMTFDRQTIDSTGAFLIGELERLDPMMHEPLVDVQWTRDIDLREDVSLADETSSFTNSSFASAGGISPNGKSWIGKDSNAIPSIALDVGKKAKNLYLWGQELSYTIPELQSAEKVGRPVDSQKLEGIQLKHQMDIDEMVYIGDTDLGEKGLLNSTDVTAANVAGADASARLWVNKTPDQILADFNTLLSASWLATGYAICPSRVLLPPDKFGYLASTKVGTNGDKSILAFLEENSIALRVNGKKLELYPSKWCSGRGAGGTDRMCAYTKDKKRVRFPLVPLQRTPLEYRSIFHLTTYFGRIGVMEFVYPETVRYADGF